MSKEKAKRNHTLTLSEKEREQFSKRLLRAGENPLLPSEIENKTLFADLNEVADLLPKAFADLIIIDPPYNIYKDFNGHLFPRMKEEAYKGFLEQWFPKIVSFLKPDGSLYLCGDWKCSTALYDIARKYLHVINRITWQREKGRGALRNWKNGMEDIWFCVKDKKNYYFDIESVKIRRRVIAPYRTDGRPKDWEESEEGKFRNTYPSNFWDDLTVPYWSMPENTDHPTQKPEKLIAKLILASCPEKGMVFDPFLGSGTSSVTAKKLGRNYCGVERNLDYCLYAEKRLKAASYDKRIQGYEDGIFWERNSRPEKKH